VAVAAAAFAWVAAGVASVAVEFGWAARASAVAAFVWEPPGSVAEPSVVPALVSGEAREFIAGSAPGFELPVYVAVMWAELDGQVASVRA
jgi:hypothetical protein